MRMHLPTPLHFLLSSLPLFIFSFSLTSAYDLEYSFFKHSSAQSTNTDAFIYNTLRNENPNTEITIAPKQPADLLAFAATGHASASQYSPGSSSSDSSQPYKWRLYSPPSRRSENSTSKLTSLIKFAQYRYEWNATTFTVYLVDTGNLNYPIQIQYILGPRAAADSLLLAAGAYANSLHHEIWVFDRGYWQKSATLYTAVCSTTWSSVILNSTMKDSLIYNVLTFFSSKSTYQKLSVPWKRGIIFHGPPGNGKTISIKATMNMLLSIPSPIPTLYVKTLSGYGELALSQIFDKARANAPCYLVFEDLDSLITPNLRSYFLNQVDGLENNDGILMVGSTNHIEWLDPGISKRPSRFDRKFFFPNPSLAERVQYALFWRRKLASNPDVEFPVALADAVAEITDGFSFAYIQEAFVASLLLMAGGDDTTLIVGHAGQEQQVVEGGKDLDGLPLWRIIQEQVKQLREELDDNAARMENVEAREGDGMMVLPVREMPLRSMCAGEARGKLD